jgi:hypothetical protein
MTDDAPDCHIVWRTGGEVTKPRKNRLGVLEGVDNRARQYRGPNLVELELEGRDDPKVAAAASEAPEEFLVFVLACVDEFTLGGDDVSRNEIVHG